MPSIDDAENRPVPWTILAFGLIAVILALVIGTQVVGVFYAILAPPLPPLPDDVTLVSHINSDYGVDEWFYISSQPLCDVVRFYQANGADCQVTPPICDTVPSDNPSHSFSVSGRCVGQTRFSIFAMGWRAMIAIPGYPSNAAAEFRLTREIFWTGSVPPSSRLQLAPTENGELQP